MIEESNNEGHISVLYFTFCKFIDGIIYNYSL